MGEAAKQPVHDGAAAPSCERSRVMLLASAHPGPELVIELVIELTVALQRLGAEVIAVGDHADARLHAVADRAVIVDMEDGEQLGAAIRSLRPDVVVTTTDAIAVDALTAAVADGTTAVIPDVRTARLTADREAMHRLADELGLPTVPCWFAGSVDELRSVFDRVGFPLRVKPVAAAPGAGESVLVRPADVEPAWQHALGAVGGGDPASHDAPRVLAEAVLDVDQEVTLLAVRNDGGSEPVLDFCAPIGHRRLVGPAGQLLLETWQPQQLSAVALDAARSIAARVVRALHGRGLFGVELLVCGDEVYFSGVNPRPGDTALVTRHTQRLSGIELAARAILGLPVDTIMVSPGAARLIYRDRIALDADPVTEPDPPAAQPAAALAAALTVTESDVLLFDHHNGDPHRRLGVALATAADVTAARDRAAAVSAALSTLWR